jgi:hypothetical protein
VSSLVIIEHESIGELGLSLEESVISASLIFDRDRQTCPGLQSRLVRLVVTVALRQGPESESQATAIPSLP